jgi:hypothetical protein
VARYPQLKYASLKIQRLLRLGLRRVRRRQYSFLCYIITHLSVKRDHEVAYKDLVDLQNDPYSNQWVMDKLGYCKLQKCAQIAQKNYEYFWIDTCCIDQSSSMELQESINSMYKWYQNAAVCYVYFEDFNEAESQVGKAGSVAIIVI